MDIENLVRRLEAGDACVAILGLGAVGLPLADAFGRAGIRVLGFDRDPEKLERLARGENTLHHLAPGLVQELVASGRLECTEDWERIAEADAVLICVPTPLGPHREPDLSCVEDAATRVARALRPGQLVVLESTTWPGTTRDVVRPILESGGLRAGVDFLLAYSPEREDAGRTDFTTRTTPKLVGGTTPEATRVAELLYARAVDEVHVTQTAEVAEAAKLFENIFRAVNIALVNEVKVVLEAMDIDVWEVLEAAATKPFGFMRFTPGPGMGGHCIPIDPFYLAWVARRFGRSTRFIELAGEINQAMPDYVVQRTLIALNERGRAVSGARVLILGLAYKPDVDVLFESPSLRLIERFAELDARVSFSDPLVGEAPEGLADGLETSTSIELDETVLAGFDAVVLATDHSAFDYDLIAAHAPLVVDTRNALAERMAALGLGERYVRA